MAGVPLNDISDGRLSEKIARDRLHNSGDYKMKSRLLATALAFGLSVFGWSSAGQANVLIQDGFIGAQNTTWNTFYNGQPGIASTVLGSGSVLNAASFAGISLFIAETPSNAYSGAEATAISNFLTAGGNVLLLGENSVFPTQNVYVNSLLAAIGSGLGIIGANNDNGLQVATPAQLVGPLMAGVVGLTYASASTVTGGTTEMFAMDLTTILMASETVGAGRLTVMGDNNLGINFTAGDQTFALNLLGSANAVPEPRTLALFGLGLAGLGFARRRKAA